MFVTLICSHMNQTDEGVTKCVISYSMLLFIAIIIAELVISYSILFFIAITNLPLFRIYD